MRAGAPTSRAELSEQLHRLGVERGAVLLVHTAFRAVRPVEGGPAGLIEALRGALGPDGTLVMPSWTGDADAPFDPRRSPSDPELGAVPQVFWRLPGVLRSGHPNAFAAVGPQAAEILRDALPLPPHVAESPVGRVSELDGQILLLGVNHDADTTIHLGELLADVPYRLPKHCTVMREGGAVRLDYEENDHCCARFVLVDGWLDQERAQSRGPVGHAVARLARSRSVVDVVVRKLSRDRLAFLHPPEAACRECDEARASTQPNRRPAGG